MRILIAGATGVVGTELMRAFRRDGHDVLGVSSRGSSAAGVIAWRLGEEAPPDLALHEWDVVVNSVASTRWNQSPADAIANNVVTVRALSQVVGPRTHVVHVSTVFAVGLVGDTRSTALASYRNTYEWSKAIAEQEAMSLFERVSIIRLPLIIGRRADGEIARPVALHTLMRSLVTGRAPAIVGDPSVRLDLVPADDAANLIVSEVARSCPVRPRVRSLGNGASAPRLDRLVTIVYEVVNSARVSAGLDPVHPAPIVSKDSWERFMLPFVTDQLSGHQFRILSLLSPFHDYLCAQISMRPTDLVPDPEEGIRSSVQQWVDRFRCLVGRGPLPWQAELISRVGAAV